MERTVCMKIYSYTPGTEIAEDGTVVALGFFDGVHAAHRRLLKIAKSLANELGLTFAVFTFKGEGAGLKGEARIYSTEEKLSILKSLGTDAVILADFPTVSGISAEDFVKKCLLDDMKCRAAVAGYDFRFGHSARGNAELLSGLLKEEGAVCHIESEHKINGEKISTTKIKELLRVGDVEAAAKFLGAPYFIRGEVSHGKGLGKSLGFPTVNSSLGESASVIKGGVYRTAVDISGTLYSAVTNIGTCPTFEGGEAMHAETYIIDYSGDLYGKNICIYLLGYLREERRFETPDELIMQINVDKNMAASQNGDLKWLEIGQN